MNMKSILKNILLAGAAVALSACSYLDKQPDNLRTSDRIWESRADAEAFLNRVYAYIWYQLDDFAGLGVADETAVPNTGVDARRWTTGNWSASEGGRNQWTPAYKAIRTALEFEANIDRVPENRINSELKDIYRNESKFLRGWFYWQLLRNYGPFVIIDHIPAIDEDFSTYRRAPFDTCVEYICDLLTEAGNGLPDKRIVSSEFGRATKAACLAVISEVRLLAASDLWNGNPVFADFKGPDGESLAPAEYDPRKWQLAAGAAYDVISLGANSLYYNTANPSMSDPYLSCRNLFLTWSDEIIFATCRAGDWQWGHDKRCTPVPGGYGMQNVTQNQVDAFYTRKGLDILDDPDYTEQGFATVDDPENYGYSEDQMNRGYLRGESNMYVNREPRFYVGVQYNGRPVLPAATSTDKDLYSSSANKNGMGRIEYYYSGVSGISNNTWLADITGYDVLKRVHPGSVIYDDKRTEYRPYIHIRYAQILLNYIEALNECNPNSTDIVFYLNEIRTRAGIPTIQNCYPAEIGDQTAMRKRILRERQVELAFEGDRYWTLCRRKMFEKEEYRKIFRMNVDTNDNNLGFAFADFYKRKELYTRYWNDRMYLFPIPQGEIDKAAGSLVQNPGW